jgi:hypothetical protein
MTVFEAFLICVDDNYTKPVFTGFPLQMYGVELLKFLCGIIVNNIEPCMQNQLKFRIFKIQGIPVLGYFFLYNVHMVAVWYQLVL